MCALSRWGSTSLRGVSRAGEGAAWKRGVLFRGREVGRSVEGRARGEGRCPFFSEGGEDAVGTQRSSTEGRVGRADEQTRWMGAIRSGERNLVRESCGKQKKKSTDRYRRKHLNLKRHFLQ